MEIRRNSSVRTRAGEKLVHVKVYMNEEEKEFFTAVAKSRGDSSSNAIRKLLSSSGFLPTVIKQF